MIGLLDWMAVKERRDAAIVSEWKSSDTGVPSLAIRYGLSERQVWSILAQYMDQSPQSINCACRQFVSRIPARLNGLMPLLRILCLLVRFLGRRF